MNNKRRNIWSGPAVDMMLDAAEELSAEEGSKFDCGSADYLHVAAARRLNRLNGIDEFWTCDVTQAGLAKSAGLKTRLFELKRPAGASLKARPKSSSRP